MPRASCRWTPFRTSRTSRCRSPPRRRGARPRRSSASSPCRWKSPPPACRASLEMRSLNKPGLSLITLVFTDKTDVYFARQLVMERIIEVAARMPAGVTPVLGPGVHRARRGLSVHAGAPRRRQARADASEELIERRTAQDWVVRPLLRSIPGVAEINSTGGYVKQYQVLVESGPPARLRSDGAGCLAGARAQQRELRRRRAAAARRAVSGSRRRPDPRPRRHPLHRAEGIQGHAGLHPRRRRR